MHQGRDKQNNKLYPTITYPAQTLHVIANVILQHELLIPNIPNISIQTLKLKLLVSLWLPSTLTPKVLLTGIQNV